jgi:hypothetical protein
VYFGELGEYLGLVGEYDGLVGEYDGLVGLENKTFTLYYLSNGATKQ